MLKWLHVLWLSLQFISELYSQIQPPIINSISPREALVGSDITIEGNLFDLTQNGNLVYFGGVRAEVITASTTSLTVRAPAGASYGPVTIIRASLSSTSQMFFNPIYKGKGILTSSSFSAQSEFSVGNSPEALDAGDLDNDGKSELIVTNYLSRTISILKNNSSGNISNGTFTTEATLNITNTPNDVQVEDMDGDGKLDVIATDLVSGVIYVFRNTTSSGTISFENGQVINITPYSNVNKIRIGDLNNDGKPDAVVTKVFDSVLCIIKNNSTVGTIALSHVQTLHLHGRPSAIQIADLDNDGYNDLSVVYHNANLNIFRHKTANVAIEDPLFDNPVVISTDHGNSDIALADLNDDQKPDIISASSSNNRISVLQNQSFPGTIAFAMQAYGFTHANNPSSITVADFDGDRKVDVMCGNLNSNLVSIFQNQTYPGSAIALDTVRNYSMGGSKYVLSRDINNDQKPDVVMIPTAANSKIWIYQNTSPIDTTAPSLFHGILATAAANTVQIVVGADETLSSVTVTANQSPILLTSNGDVFFGSLALQDTAQIDLDITGYDVAHNVCHVSKQYFIASDQHAVSSGTLTISPTSKHAFVLAEIPTTIKPLPDGYSLYGKPITLVTASDRSPISINWNANTAAKSDHLHLYYFEQNRWVEVQSVSASASTGSVTLDPQRIKQNGLTLAVLQRNTELVQPNSVRLYQNYPNPFNPTTSIGYHLPQAGHVRIDIYNILGQRIKTLIHGLQPAGDHRAVWDGNNEQGMRVGSGIYIYRLHHNKSVLSRTMTLLK